MAFKQVQDLDTDVTTALGGLNKKTGKKNPTRAEGYFLGSRRVESKKAKSGYAYLHILQTADGNLGVWGKTDLDRKMTNVTPGAMVRITQSGTVPTPNGDMYKFKVEIDEENTIEVSAALSASQDSGEEEEQQETSSSESFEEEQEEEGEDETPADEAPWARTTPPRRAAQPPSAAAQAKTKALLGGGKNKVA